MAFDLKTLEKLLLLAKKNKLAELEVEDGKQKIRIRTALDAATTVVSGGFAAHPAVHAPEPQKKTSGKDEDRYANVLSPFVGTFYRSPSPEAEPYVKEGQMVKKGDVLCIIEAMKLMNEIESETSGKIVSVLAENGQPVEYGEALFLIDPV
ncbi:MAG: acetyl-CoA carboxylase biotin carboxyl carrier protein [Deltaproteobacteria bacterium]|nr:acetyl-CoA carboxylase biotin carboxyl carrier protein [Deltaproteobacteria bacterium]